MPALKFELRHRDTGALPGLIHGVWTRSGIVTDLGDFESLPGVGGAYSAWLEFTVELGDAYSPNGANKLEFTRLRPSNVQLRNVRVERLTTTDYGQYPIKFPYPVEYIGGLTLPTEGDPGYIAQLGETIEPSDYNYTIDWGTKPGGFRAKDFDDWMDTGASWWTGFGAYQKGRDDPQGTPTFTLMGRNMYPELRPDGFVGAPHHNIDMSCITAGSRGMSNIGPIWGWNSWSDFWFYLGGGHSAPTQGVWRMSGGVATLIAPLTGDGFGFDAHVRHNFLTGDLHVWTYDPFLGGTNDYYGTHPHSVGAGYSGWIADQQDSSLGFWDTTGCSTWAMIFEPGLIIPDEQYSMETLEFEVQNPSTWIFGNLIVPELRQRQRDDSRVARVHRRGNEPTSRQFSGRQGHRNTYL